MYNMLGKLVSMIVTTPEQLLGILVDLLEKITGPNGHEWIRELKRFLRKEPCWIQRQDKEVTEPKPIIYTRCISGDEVITIGATTGLVSISGSTKIFNGGIYSGFSAALGVAGQARGPVRVSVHDQIVNGNFAQIIGSLGCQLFTQHQVVSFVEKNHEWLRKGERVTCLPFRAGNEAFVAVVDLIGHDRFSVGVRRLSYVGVWNVNLRHRFVVPELELTVYTRRISGDEVIIIDATDGSVTIPGSINLFMGGINNNSDVTLEVQGQARGPVKVSVHEQTVDGNFTQIIGGLGNKFFTQHQVVKFIEKNKEWLRKKGETFLPFIVEDEDLVAHVYYSGDGTLTVDIYSFSHSTVWIGNCRSRIVVPQQEPPAPSVT